MKKSVAVVAIVGGLAASASQAAVIMQTQNFGPSTPNFSSLLSFDKFDPSLGTLQSVTVKLSLSVDGGRLELDNDGVDPASGTATIGADGAIVSMDVPLLNALLQPVVSTVVATNSTMFSIAGNDGDSVGSFESGGSDCFLFLGTPASDSESGVINPAFLAAYIGAGDTFQLTANVGQIFEYGALGGISFSGFPVTAQGNVMVTYEYEPVPAPGAGALAAGGGLLVLRRRRGR